ncbi:PAS domain-containing protein [Crenobacter cavernae]|uniref:histidine kinase n=2 Tax=Crenobacter cavernae TaxID=2290923 RepID=A0A345Y8T0_9NEIS|nr:PAS domain-containing protein [Crenobacter cavernae]
MYRFQEAGRSMTTARPSARSRQPMKSNLTIGQNERPPGRLRAHLALLQELPLKHWLLALLLWLALSAGMALFGHALVIERYREGFQQSAQQIKQELESRLKVSETLLFGLSEMLGYHPGLSVDRFYNYALEASRRYPFIYTMSYLPKVAARERSGFEQSLPLTDPSAPYIKDHPMATANDWRNRRGWVPAPDRAVYFPWLIAAPALAKEDDALTGFDMLNDQLFGPVLQKAFRSGETEVTTPFVMMNGETALGYVRAIYRTTPAPEEPEQRTGQVTGSVVLIVRINGLLEQHYPLNNRLSVGLSLYGDAPTPLEKTVYQAMPSANPSSLEVLLLPKLSARLPVDIPYFPYELVVEEQVPEGVIQPAILLAALVFSGALCYLMAVVMAQNVRTRRHREDAVDDLYRERGHAMVTLQAINDAVLTVDTQMRVRYLNPMAVKLLGIDPEFAVGRPVYQTMQLRYEFARQAVADPIMLCLQRGQGVDLAENCVLAPPDREPLLIEGSVSPLFDRGGELFGAVMAFRNTAPLRQRMLEALEASEKRLRQHEVELARVGRINTMGEMASGIAHELNQPLSAIVSYCQAALSFLDDAEPNKEMVIKALQSSVSQADRAGQIIHRLRAFVTKSQQQWVPVDLNLSVANVMTLAEYDLRTSQIHVATHLEPGLPLVFADTIQIEQVVLNLLRNAIDAVQSRPGWGEMTLETGLIDDRVCLTVRDNGCGLPEDVLDHLFDPFFTTKQHGMGLGLTICHSIVESFGGRLSARNRLEGGAEFRMELPRLSPGHFAQQAASERTI